MARMFASSSGSPPAWASTRAPGEVLLGDGVPAGVMRHPPGHIGQGRRDTEDVRAPIAPDPTEQPGGHLGLKVVDDGRVHVPAPQLGIGGAERPQGGDVGVDVAGRVL